MLLSSSSHIRPPATCKIHPMSGHPYWLAIRFVADVLDNDEQQAWERYGDLKPGRHRPSQDSTNGICRPRVLDEQSTVTMILRVMIARSHWSMIQRWDGWSGSRACSACSPVLSSGYRGGGSPHRLLVACRRGHDRASTMMMLLPSLAHRVLPMCHT